jgi:hypothetical protein
MRNWFAVAKPSIWIGAALALLAVGVDEAEALHPKS